MLGRMFFASSTTSSNGSNSRQKRKTGEGDFAGTIPIPFFKLQTFFFFFHSLSLLKKKNKKKKEEREFIQNLDLTYPI
ncbi:hypothetical protein VNO78_18342 [Psophocarpus tetragonolobus]|uniref:Uncharacterized protein n=1 Tax=Psophocarpus tetragonolobus TaxID=3891 RepID=A0AAN9SJ58_PSOTE